MRGCCWSGIPGGRGCPPALAKCMVTDSSAASWVQGWMSAVQDMTNAVSDRATDAKNAAKDSGKGGYDAVTSRLSTTHATARNQLAATRKAANDQWASAQTAWEKATGQHRTTSQKAWDKAQVRPASIS